ncbi:MAG: tRNA pseudouridine(38-40) synthase TruA [Candidatus Omnitrophota bacterium]
MRTIKLIIEYDGTAYCGWQSQKTGCSVQETIEKALKKILGEKITVTGAGRTDSGVHAKGQVASFRTVSDLEPGRIRKALNANLPTDIRIAGAVDSAPGFNAQFDAKSKIYRYTIVRSDCMSPFLVKYAAPVSYDLDIGQMLKAAQKLLGRHDFASFMSAHGSARTSTRTVKNVSVRKRGRLIYIDIEADGFLYNMVRAIAGTLIEIGRGRMSPAIMGGIISARDRSKAGPTAPARGLCLMRVKYGNPKPTAQSPN